MRPSHVALLAAILAASPLMADPFPDTGVRVLVPSVAAGQIGTQSTFSCPDSVKRAYDGSGLPSGDDLSVIRRIDAVVRKGVRYRKDPAGEDLWSNFAISVLSGETHVGDCEDFATTAITLALCAGVPAERLGIALSDNRRSGPRGVSGINHAFAYYVKDGVPFSFADTSSSSVRRVSFTRDGVMLWQGVTGLLKAPATFRASINP